MTLDLSHDEAVALSRFLEDHLHALQIDASRTDAPEAKREMWALEHKLLAIRDRLRAFLAGGDLRPDIAP